MMKSINNGANMWKSAYDDNPANPISTFGMIAGILFYDIVAIVIFFLYFFLFLFRYMALWILVILSPLAFVSYVFPFTKKFWDLWWNNFLQWCIIGIPAAFFMWLADKILSGMIKSADVSSVGFATYLVPGMMLIIGFLFTLQTSAMGASSVISAAKWAGKGTGGAIKELTGRSKTGQKYREKAMRAVDRIAETAGFSKQGTAMINASAREKSEMATINALRTSSNPADQSRYEQLVKTGQGARGAAAIAAANENGDLSRILNPNNDAAGLDQIKARVALAKAFGHESGEFTKKNYQLKQFDTKAVDKALTDQGLDPALVSPGDARRTKAEQDVMMAQLADNLPQMSGAEMGNVDSRHLGITNHEFTRENITPHMVQKIGVSSNAALIESVKRDYLNFFKDMNDAKRDGNKAEENRLRKIMEAIDKLP
jgi:hypothetical protein